jgi:hypothetical protein
MGFVGSGIHSRSSHIKSPRKEFENRTGKGTRLESKDVAN